MRSVEEIDWWPYLNLTSENLAESATELGPGTGGSTSTTTREEPQSTMVKWTLLLAKAKTDADRQTTRLLYSVVSSMTFNTLIK